MLLTRVSQDYPFEMDEDLFKEIEPVQGFSLESSTLVTVECKWDQNVYKF